MSNWSLCPSGKNPTVEARAYSKRLVWKIPEAAGFSALFGDMLDSDSSKATAPTHVAEGCGISEFGGPHEAGPHSRLLDIPTSKILFPPSPCFRLRWRPYLPKTSSAAVKKPNKREAAKAKSKAKAKASANPPDGNSRGRGKK